MKVYQKNDSDCLQASLATLLNINYESIPEFYKFVNKEKGFYNAYVDWLKKEGLVSITVVARYIMNKDINNEKTIWSDLYDFTGTIKCLGILQRKDREWSHTVVLEINKDRTIKMFDPSRKGSDFTLDDLWHIEIIFKEGK
jgi:hypothetical protein